MFSLCVACRGSVVEGRCLAMDVSDATNIPLKAYAELH